MCAKEPSLPLKLRDAPRGRGRPYYSYGGEKAWEHSLFVRSTMNQSLVDDVLVINAGYNSDRSSESTTSFNVDSLKVDWACQGSYGAGVEIYGDYLNFRQKYQIEIPVSLRKDAAARRMD